MKTSYMHAVVKERQHFCLSAQTTRHLNFYVFCCLNLYNLIYRNEMSFISGNGTLYFSTTKNAHMKCTHFYTFFLTFYPGTNFIGISIIPVLSSFNNGLFVF